MSSFFNRSIAVENAPTPGKITQSEFLIELMSDETITLKPTFLHACSMLNMLPTV